MLYYVLPWRAGEYSAADALAVYGRESVAERKADALNAAGLGGPDGAVVRPEIYVRTEELPVKPVRQVPLRTIIGGSLRVVSEPILNGHRPLAYERLKDAQEAAREIKEPTEVVATARGASRRYWIIGRDANA